MKQLMIATAVLAALGLSSVVNAAEQHTVTLGYAQTKIQDVDDVKPKGANIKYRYEWDSSVSVISSFTYTSASNHEHDDIFSGSVPVGYQDYNFKIKSYSLSAGPAYRVNELISAYALVGLNYSKLDYSDELYDGPFIDIDSGSKSATNLAYGLGLQINPIPNVAIDLAYERSKVTAFDDSKLSTNSFHIGAGYRF